MNIQDFYEKIMRYIHMHFMFLDNFLPMFVYVLFIIGVHKVHLTGPVPLWDFLLDTLEYIQRYTTIVKIF